MLRILRIGASLLLGGVFSASANDTFVHESAGNLMFVQTNSVAIQRERLVIGPPIQPNPAFTATIPIHVEYELENASGAPVKARIGFPSAACSLGDYINAKHMTFLSGSAATCPKEPKMNLVVDGGQMIGQWGFVFLRDRAPLGNGPSDAGLGKRIGALINLVRDPDERFFAQDPEFLRDAKLLCDQLGGKMKDADCSAFERILVHRTFLWDYTFPAHAKTHVVHDYQVGASWNLHPDDVFHTDAFCLNDPSTRPAWTKYMDRVHRDEATFNARKSDNYPYPLEFFTEYVLKTGALWAGPIKDFELVIRKSSPQQLISTCFTGLTKTTPLEFRTHRANFKPSEDLRILYLPDR
jgi:Domain of unknown function (DUF4424)